MTKESSNYNIKGLTKGLSRRIKQHIIAKEHRYFAIFQPGFEDVVRKELETLGIKQIGETSDGGIEFNSKLADCYTVNICSRTINRIIMRISEFKADRFDKLRKKTAEIPWELYIADGSNIDFTITSRKSRLYHTGRVNEELSAGIRERLAVHGIETTFSKNVRIPGHERIFVRLLDDRCTISLDTTGELLYRRGSKTYISRAPLRESTAAAILMEADLLRYDVFLDPMCGSGTFSLEAAGIYARKSPNIDREFAFQQWPCYRPGAFNYLRKSISSAAEPASKLIPLIHTSDINAKSVEITGRNMKKAGIIKSDFEDETPHISDEYGCRVTLFQHDFFSPLTLDSEKRCLIVINPPYGTRLQRKNIESFYRKMGNVLRNYYPEAGWAIITPGLEFEKILSVSYDRKIRFNNGGIKVAVIFKDAW